MVGLQFITAEDSPCVFLFSKFSTCPLLAYVSFGSGHSPWTNYSKKDGKREGRPRTNRIQLSSEHAHIGKLAARRTELRANEAHTHFLRTSGISNSSFQTYKQQRSRARFDFAFQKTSCLNRHKGIFVPSLKHNKWRNFFATPFALTPGFLNGHSNFHPILWEDSVPVLQILCCFHVCGENQASGLSISRFIMNMFCLNLFAVSPIYHVLDTSRL